MKNKPKIVLSYGLIAILFSVVNIYANAGDGRIGTLTRGDIGKKLVCPITEENLYSTRKISYHDVSVSKDILSRTLKQNQSKNRAIYKTNEGSYIFYDGNEVSTLKLKENVNINLTHSVENGELNEDYCLTVFENYPHLQGYKDNLWLKINSDEFISTNFGDVKPRDAGAYFDGYSYTISSIRYNTNNQLLEVSGGMRIVATHPDKKGPDREEYPDTAFSFFYATRNRWIISGSPIKNFQLKHEPIACYIQNKEDNVSIHVKAADGEAKIGE